MKIVFNITGMTCAACSARVEKVARSVKGVEKVNVNLLSGKMTVQAVDGSVEQQIITEITKAGYGVSTATSHEAKQQDSYTGMGRNVLISAIFLIVLMYFTMGSMLGIPMPSWYVGANHSVAAGLIQLMLTLPIIMINGGYFVRGIKALWHRSPNMDSLVAVGSAASLIYSIVLIFAMSYALGYGDFSTAEHCRHRLYFESAAMILTLVSFGKFLEARAKSKTGEAVRKLMDLSPSSATVLKDGVEVVVPIEQIVPGNILIVKPGGRIPVDGVVVNGHGAVDQSALTGESVPVYKQVGDSVSAATINREGYLQIRAQKVGQDTLLSQIIRIVEDAGGSKAPIARLADKIAGIFVPTVMSISAVVFIVWMLIGRDVSFSLSAAVSVLVISCPCALGLATPVAIMVGTGRGAGLGVLFKDAEALEVLHNIDTVVFDKTGTLTTGQPAVTDIIPCEIAGKQLLAVAAELEWRSEHPFAKAVMQKACGISVGRSSNFEVIPGMGVSAVIDNKRYYGGNERLMEHVGVCVPPYEDFAEQGKTPLYFAEETRYLGMIAAADVLKPEAATTVDALKKIGIRTVMLTGDHQKTAEYSAAQAGIDEAIAEVLPAQKGNVIRKLQENGRILMVGDGINDAPALTIADLGMAVCGGTDIAMDCADVVLMREDLGCVYDAIRLSRATIRNIRQNLFWAFFYNCLGIPLAALGLLNPMIGAACMSVSSVFVVTNALRLRGFKGTPKAEANEFKQEEEQIMETVIRVNGMMCPHCKARVEEVCKGFSGVDNAEVDLQAKIVTVTGNADIAQIKKAISDAGYEVVD